MDDFSIVLFGSMKPGRMLMRLLKDNKEMREKITWDKLRADKPLNKARPDPLQLPPAMKMCG